MIFTIVWDTCVDLNYCNIIHEAFVSRNTKSKLMAAAKSELPSISLLGQYASGFSILK